MKTFLRNAFVFLLPCVVALAAIAAWAVSSEIRLYRSRIRIPPDVRYVVIGDSQCETAVDPACFPHLVNQSVAALSLDQALYKIRDVLSVNADRDFAVIFDVSPRRPLQAFMPLKASDFESRYAILNFRHVFNSRRKIGEPIRLMRDRIVRDAFNHFTARKFTKKRKKQPKSPWGGFQPRSERRWLTCPGETAQETDGYVSDTLMDAASADMALAHNLAIIDEAMATVAAAGKRMVLVTTPWHRTLLKKLPQGLFNRFRADMRALADRHGVRWIDTLDWDTPDDGWLNQNHLNAEGAVRYTRHLCEQILKEE